MPARFELILFSTRPDYIRRAVAGGASGVIVDWENVGKRERQGSADTQINADTPEDLQVVRTCGKHRVLCRINSVWPGTDREVGEAVAGGADEVLVPMVRSVGEVERVLRLARGRCEVGILVETVAAVAIAEALARLPLCRVYVGLNDLAIERGSVTIFEAIADGTVERVREQFPHVPFGFAGLTLPDRGDPIPCRLLIAEMARLDCRFSFLRRSFFRDTAGQDPAEPVRRILDAVDTMRKRERGALAADHRELVRHICRLGDRTEEPRWA